MNIKDIYQKNISDLADEEIEYVLKISRRLSQHLPDARNLFDVPGTGFGYAHHVEREQIKRRLIANGAIPGSTELHFAVIRDQERIHKNDPPFSVYQKILTKVKEPVKISFTAEELTHIIEHFENANDPFVQGIVEKAQKQLALI